MSFEQDIPSLYREHGVPAQFGDQLATVILDIDDAEVLGNRVQSTNYKIRYAATDFDDLSHGNLVTVAGVQYSVITVSFIDDGAEKTALLQRV